MLFRWCTNRSYLELDRPQYLRLLELLKERHPSQHLSAIPKRSLRRPSKTFVDRILWHNRQQPRDIGVEPLTLHIRVRQEKAIRHPIARWRKILVFATPRIFARSLWTIAEKGVVEAKRARVMMGMSECILNEGGEIAGRSRAVRCRINSC